MMNSMDREYTCMPMDKYTMVWSNEARWKEKECTTIPMAMPTMMALGIRAKKMEKDYTTASKKFIKESGNMDKEQGMHITIIKSIDRHILAILYVARDMAEVDWFLQMAVSTLDSL